MAANTELGRAPSPQMKAPSPTKSQRIRSNSFFSVRFGDDEYVPETNVVYQKRPFLHRLLDIEDNNAFGAFLFVLLHAASLCMLSMPYLSRNVHDDGLWRWHLIQYTVSMVAFPLFFIVTKWNVLCLHSRFYADYIHCAVTALFVLSPLFCAVLIWCSPDDAAVSLSFVSLLLLISVYFLALTINSRLWILWTLHRMTALLSLYILSLIALTLSIHLHRQWDSGHDAVPMSDEVVLFRGYLVLLWLAVISWHFVHDPARTLLSSLCRRALCTVQCIVYTVTVPVLCTIFYDDDGVMEIVVLSVNGLIALQTVQLMVFYGSMWPRRPSPPETVCCLSSLKRSKRDMFWAIIHGLTALLIAAQV